MFAICAVLILGSAVAIRTLWQADDASAPAAAEPEPDTAGDVVLPEEPEISDARYPTVLSNGQSFGLRGKILCRYLLTEVRGTVANRVTGEVIFDVPVYPNATYYAVGNPTDETINDSLVFDSPECSNSYLNYKLTVKYKKDGEYRTKVLLDQNFKVGTPVGDPPDDA